MLAIQEVENHLGAGQPYLNGQQAAQAAQSQIDHMPIAQMPANMAANNASLASSAPRKRGRPKGSKDRVPRKKRAKPTDMNVPTHVDNLLS
jgi:hypothetical protein